MRLKKGNREAEVGHGVGDGDDESRWNRWTSDETRHGWLCNETNQSKKKSGGT